MLAALAEYHAWLDAHGKKWSPEAIIMLEETWMLGEHHRETLEAINVPPAYIPAYAAHEAWLDEWMWAIRNYYDYYMDADEVFLGIGEYFAERSERQRMVGKRELESARAHCAQSGVGREP